MLVSLCDKTRVLCHIALHTHNLLQVLVLLYACVCLTEIEIYMAVCMFFGGYRLSVICVNMLVIYLHIDSTPKCNTRVK